MDLLELAQKLVNAGESHRTHHMKLKMGIRLYGGPTDAMSLTEIRTHMVNLIPQAPPPIVLSEPVGTQGDSVLCTECEQVATVGVGSDAPRCDFHQVKMETAEEDGDPAASGETDDAADDAGMACVECNDSDEYNNGGGCWSCGRNSPDPKNEKADDVNATAKKTIKVAKKAGKVLKINVKAKGQAKVVGLSKTELTGLLMSKYKHVAKVLEWSTNGKPAVVEIRCPKVHSQCEKTRQVKVQDLFQVTHCRTCKAQADKNKSAARRASKAKATKPKSAKAKKA